MINWSCIIQGQHRLSINCSVAASSSLTGECKCAAACTSLPAPLPKDHSSPSSCASLGDFNFTAMYPSLSSGLLGPSAHCYHNKYHSLLDLLCFFHMQTQENGFGTERGRGTVWSIVSIRWPGASNFQSASVFPSTQWR